MHSFNFQRFICVRSWKKVNLSQSSKRMVTGRKMSYMSEINEYMAQQVVNERLSRHIARAGNSIYGTIDIASRRAANRE